jgi:UDP-N-acetylmuramyl pentapeptide phosphotransferase/UDP-N-acetylglucosamine-1-phosphate transferase
VGEPWLALLVAMLASGLLSWPVIALLKRRQVMDVPNIRSSHQGAIPRGAGIAVLLGTYAGAVVGDVASLTIGILVATTAAGLIGLLDDLRDLGPGLRLLLTLALSGALAWWVLLGPVESTSFRVLLATIVAVWLTGYVNAFNFMDGINGISAVCAVVAGGWYWLLGTWHDIPTLSAGALVVGASLGFMPWNVPRARAFLGDVGSYTLGMFIACLAVVSVSEGVAPVLALAPLAVYLADTSWTLLRRLLRGEPPLRAHREHVYQRLCDVGWSHGQVVAFVAAVVLAICATTRGFSPLAAVPVSLALLVGYLSSPGLLMWAKTRNQRPVA